MLCFILRHRHVGGQCQITAVYMIHTWCNWHDEPCICQCCCCCRCFTLPSTHNCYTNAAWCISSSCVFETGTNCLCGVAGWTGPEVLHKGGSIQVGAGCSEGSSRHTHRETPTPRVPENKKGSEMLTPLCSCTQQQICLHGSACSCFFFFPKDPQLGSIHISIMSCSSDRTEIVVNCLSNYSQQQHESQDGVRCAEAPQTATVAREVSYILRWFSVAH